MILKYTEDFDISGLLVLVDFEKAFDFISYFGPNILKWI